MAGSRTMRAGTKRTGVRRRAVGTRDRIVTHLGTVTEITDSTGMASTKLAEAVGYPGSSVAFAQLLSGMERDGLIEREVRGKRTYRITLPGDRAARAHAGTSHGGAVASRGAGPVDADLAVIDGQAVASAGSSFELDYDELARRLLIQVVRRLAAAPSDLEETVAGLERELVTARTRHGTLTAENVRLREQLEQTRRDLDQARQRSDKVAIADELDTSEVVVLEQLLASDGGGDVSQPPRPRAGGRELSGR